MPGTEEHEISKNYLIEKMKELNLVPGNNGSWLQSINTDKKTVGENIIGLLPGKSDKYILLIAHYYTVPSIPGADDNAVAIAIILETIKSLPVWRGDANIMVLFCDMEEPPYFHTPIMGSTYFYNHCPIDNNKISCAIVLDLVGHDISFEPLKDALFVTGAEYSNNLLDFTTMASKSSEGISVYPIRNNIVGNMSDHHIFETIDHFFLCPEECIITITQQQIL